MLRGTVVEHMFDFITYVINAYGLPDGVHSLFQQELVLRGYYNVHGTSQKESITLL